MRSDLLRIISSWEQTSGQGEGGRDQEDVGDDEEQEDTITYDGDEEEEEGFGAEQPAVLDDNISFITSQTSPASANDTFPRRRANIGTLRGRPARALQSRAAFLNGRPSYLLYFWEVADTHQLLQSSLQRLSNHTGASDASQAQVLLVEVVLVANASRSCSQQVIPRLENHLELLRVPSLISLSPTASPTAI